MITSRAVASDPDEAPTTGSATDPSRSPIRTAIIGSCVSRDMFSFLDRSAFSLTSYVPRQSVITARNPPRGYLVDLGALTSAFQRRVTDQALHGGMLETVRQARPDLVLWDLTDERTGVYLMPDGSHLTRSVELDAAGLTTSIIRHATRHIPFGSEEHFDLFRRAAIWLGRSIRALEPEPVVAIVAPPWAELLDDDTPAPASYGIRAPEANTMFRRYVGAAERATGAVALTMPAGDVTGAVEHRWGAAPFHYSDRVYEALASDVTLLVSGVQDRTAPDAPREPESTSPGCPCRTPTSATAPPGAPSTSSSS